MARPLLALLALALLAGRAVAAPAISYVARPPADAAVIIDARGAALCEKATLPRARCLPATDALGPHRRLANISGLLWLVGTVGLEGAEHVLVIGDAGPGKEFLAGLLFILGQRRISVLTRPVADFPVGELRPGTLRAKTRERVFQAPVREDRVVLRDELAAMIRKDASQVILDGRSEAEYLGQRIRAARGGRIPGARLSPASEIRPAPGGEGPFAASKTEQGPVIVYGHDAFEGLVYLARVIAGGLDARVFLPGWAAWAADGALPADAETFASPRFAAPAVVSAPWRVSAAQVLLAALLGGLLLAAGWLMGRRKEA